MIILSNSKNLVNSNIITCRFCGKEMDKIQIKKNGDFGFCPHCHKVLLIKAPDMTTDKHSKKEFFLTKKEFNCMYELTFYIILTYVLYLAITHIDHNLASAFFFHFPYMIVTCAFLPYFYAKYIASIYLYYRLIIAKTIKCNYFVLLIYLLSFVLAMHFIGKYAFAPYSLYVLRDLAFLFVMITMLITRIRNSN